MRLSEADGAHVNQRSSPCVASCLLALPRHETDPEIEGSLTHSPQCADWVIVIIACARRSYTPTDRTGKDRTRKGQDTHCNAGSTVPNSSTSQRWRGGFCKSPNRASWVTEFQSSALYFGIRIPGFPFLFALSHHPQPYQRRIVNADRETGRSCGRTRASVHLPPSVFPRGPATPRPPPFAKQRYQRGRKTSARCARAIVVGRSPEIRRIRPCCPVLSKCNACPCQSCCKSKETRSSVSKWIFSLQAAKPRAQ
jgi:hypothetical protein